MTLGGVTFSAWETGFLIGLAIVFVTSIVGVIWGLVELEAVAAMTDKPVREGDFYPMRMTTPSDSFQPTVLPSWLYDTLTEEQKASGYYVRMEELPEPPSDKPVRYTNRAARRAEERKR